MPLRFSLISVPQSGKRNPMMLSAVSVPSKSSNIPLETEKIVSVNNSGRSKEFELFEIKGDL